VNASNIIPFAIPEKYFCIKDCIGVIHQIVLAGLNMKLIATAIKPNIT